VLAYEYEVDVIHLEVFERLQNGLDDLLAREAAVVVGRAAGNGSDNGKCNFI
jgi:hypothetical protein